MGKCSVESVPCHLQEKEGRQGKLALVVEASSDTYSNAPQVGGFDSLGCLMQLTWLAWRLVVATGHMESVKKSLWQIWHTGHAMGYAEKERETITIQHISTYEETDHRIC